MKRKITLIVGTTALCVALLTGCGDNASTAESKDEGVDSVSMQQETAESIGTASQESTDSTATKEEKQRNAELEESARKFKSAENYQASGEYFKAYQELYNMGIELVFLKEPYINTATYRSSVKQQEDAAQANKCSDEDTAAFVGGLMTLLNNYINRLTRKQIKQAFEQSQKEVDDLHERTREGIQTARLAGKQIGQREGAKLTVKKAAPAKAAILKHCADFGGTLSDKECMQLAGVSRNTYFKYKRELKEQQ